MLASMFNRQQFDDACTAVATTYEKSAPTVVDWCDWLCSAKDDEITLADVSLLAMLHAESIPANYAANRLYHLQERLGRDTVGQAGF